MGVPSGGNLGAAQGSITINTTQAQQAVPVMRGVAQGVTQAMNQVGAGANNAQQGITGLASAFRGLAGAFGFALGVQSVVQLAKMAVAANETATAFNRQAVAARNLAGSQEQLNYLLEAYQKASGGAVDKATALADVTVLLSQGFAGTAEQVEQFVAGVRGASIAMGKSQEYIQQYVSLAIANQSTMRLNEIGLGIAEVEQRVASLRAANASMTKEAAFSAAILGLLNEKYGDLAKSAEGQKTELEKAGAKWKDLGLAMGELLSAPMDSFFGGMNKWLDETSAKVEVLVGWVKAAQDAIDKLRGISPGAGAGGVPSWMTGVSKAASAPLLPDHTQDIRSVRLDWSKGITQLNADTNQQLIDQNEDYQRQRADSEREYQKSTSREAEDFARSRARQEQDLVDSIADIHNNAARREKRQAEDLARGIAQAHADSEERIADARKDSAKRLAELEEDYTRDREKAQRHYHKDLLEAAGSLDAKQVAELQNNFKEQETDAKQAHDDQRDKIAEQLQERLDDEAKNLAKSIRQQNEAYDRQLADARENDALRLEEMQADFAKRQEQEDIDRGIRLERMAIDHDDQMAEMERAQGERIQQIQTHAAEERAQMDDEHKRALKDLGVRNQQWIDEIKRADDAALEELDRLLYPVRVWMNHPSGILPTPDGLPLNGMGGANAVPPAASAAGGTSINRTVGNISFSIYAAPGQSPQDIADVVDARLKEHLTEWAK